MEMRLRAPVTRGYFFLLGALPLVNAASPRNIDQKKISSGTQGSEFSAQLLNNCTNQRVGNIINFDFLRLKYLNGYQRESLFSSRNN